MRFSSRFVLLLAALTPLPLLALDANMQVSVERIQKFASLQVTALKLALAADQASAGNAYAFDELMSLREQGAKLVAAEPVGDPQLASFIRAWHKLDTDIEHVIEGKDAMLAATSAEAEFVDKMPGLSARVEDAARLIPDHKGSGSQVELVRRLMTLPERMRRRITNIVTGDDTIVVLEADGLLRDIKFYGIALDAVVNGNKGLGVSAVANEAARKGLQEVLAQWPDVEASATRAIDAAPMIESLRQAAGEARSDGNSAVLLALPLMRAQ
jgi:twitching motility protein PilJ